MNQAFHKSFAMLKMLVRRDWIKLIIWIVAALLFVASGVGKFEVALNTSAAHVSMFEMFQNPAFIGLFGPTSVTKAVNYTIGAIFGQSMPLMMSILFGIISLVYVVNRTRKEENEGITELLRSFRIGKLANTTALVIELFLLQLILTTALAFSIQVQHVPTMTNLSSNFLLAGTIGAQGFLWGMIALFFAQIFPEAGTAKGVTGALMGVLYILRMGTDIQKSNLGWLNPLSWSYLTNVYVKDNWLPVILTLLLSGILLLISYFLELARDVNAGYLPEGNGRAHAHQALLSLPGLVLRQQRTSIIGWLLGLFVAGIMYGSMFSKMGNFIATNATIRAMVNVTKGAAGTVIIVQYMSMLFTFFSIAAAAFAIISLARMVSEERKNRQEQLYALKLSRTKMYLTYVVISLILGALAQFVVTWGMYLAQLGNQNSLSFYEVMVPGLVWIPGIWFMIGLLALLMAFIPRFDQFIWAYIGFTFFIGYLGAMLDFPKWLMRLSVFYHIPKIPVARISGTSIPVDKLALGNIWIIMVLALIFLIIGLIGYRRRDLITG